MNLTQIAAVVETPPKILRQYYSDKRDFDKENKKSAEARERGRALVHALKEQGPDYGAAIEKLAGQMRPPKDRYEAVDALLYIARGLGIHLYRDLKERAKYYRREYGIFIAKHIHE